MVLQPSVPARGYPAGTENIDVQLGMPQPAASGRGSRWGRPACCPACSLSPAHICPSANPVSSADTHPESDHSHPCSAPDQGCRRVISHLGCPQDLPAGLAAPASILRAVIYTETGVIYRTVRWCHVVLTLIPGTGLRTPPGTSKRLGASRSWASCSRTFPRHSSWLRGVPVSVKGRCLCCFLAARMQWGTGTCFAYHVPEPRAAARPQGFKCKPQ